MQGPHHLPLLATSGLVDLAEPRGDHDHASYPTGRAVVYHHRGDSTRYHHHREVDRIRYVAYRAVGAHPPHRLRYRMNRVDRTPEPAFDERAVATPAELARVLGGADECDATGSEEAIEGGHVSWQWAFRWHTRGGAGP